MSRYVAMFLIGFLGGAFFVWVFVLGGPAASNPVVNAEYPEAGEREVIFVLVSALQVQNDSSFVTVDEVEWLEGDTAWQAVATETECELDNADECMPSLYNNFYIRNVEIEETVYPLADDPLIRLSDQAQPATSTIGDLELKLEQLPIPLPFHLTVEHGEITILEEQYLP